jgi:hypothetical protein
MESVSQQIHLILEEHSPVEHGDRASAGARLGTGQAPALVVPANPAWLVSSPNESPHLATAKPGGTATSLLIEPVTQGQQLRLLVVCPPDRRVRVNGIVAPWLVVLKEMDCIDLDADVTCHVSIFHQPSVGPASATLLGKECPVCRVPFTADSRAYTCACGAAMHHQDAGAVDSLQCAQLLSSSGCPVCRRPVVLEPGYRYALEVGCE